MAPGDPRRVARFTWTVVAAALVSLMVSAWWALTDAARGPAYAPVTAQPRSTRSPTRSMGGLQLAGSGTNLPLTTRLARAYADRHPDPRLTVHPSIGSGGGLAALRDGVIDVALVSRDPRPEELGAEFKVVPYAQAAVVFAAHPDVPVDRVHSRDLLALYTGIQPSWHDGQPVVVLLREPGDSGTQAALLAIEGFAAADRRARQRPSARVLYRDREMQQALTNTPGAIGLFDLGTVRLEQLPLRVLAYEEHVPSLATLRDGSYPLTKTLAFVVRHPSSPSVARFLAFVRSPVAQRIIEDGHYLALLSPPPRDNP
ncbi:MAG: hypothetical protein B7733_10035 [Myxococcales bacterium FL481]|nr:MAG: hypothetical protein B7733_10035 [Myxococcales bacterium FL481]